MLAFLLFIIVFTLIFGRVFCGWACPQTIFLEMVFRRIEYWIEGNANKQKLADKKPGDAAYYLRKALKHIIFLLISFLIANTFLSYIIGVDQLFRIINEPITDHLAGFFGIVGFTLVFYSVFAFVRDLVCTLFAPMGGCKAYYLIRTQ
jgi:polyferredoxin